MTSKTSQPNPPPHDPLEIVVPEDQEGTELYDSPTPDSYDPHIVPAETAARKEREDRNFKHLAEHPAGSDSIDTTGGFTVDKEGLVNNFGIEPEMYYEKHGDLLDKVEQQTRAAGHVSEIRQEALRQDEICQEAVRQEAVLQEELRLEAVRQEELRQDQDELRQEELRQNQEVVRQEALRREVVRQEELRLGAIRQEELRIEAIRQEDLRQNQEELRLEAVRQEDLHREADRQEELRLEAVRQEELRQDQDELRQEELRQNQEAVRQEELRQELKQLGVGTFSSYETTEIALGELKNTGFLMDRVSVVGRDINSHTEVTGAHTSSRLANVSNLDTNENKAEEGAKDGVIAGSAVGVFTGLLVGLGLIAIPGIGPVMLAGAAATAIASAISGGVIGAAAGSLAGGLVGLGIPEHRAQVYIDRVSQGDYLVMVEGSEADIALAESIFRNRGIDEWHVYELLNRVSSHV